MTFGHSGWVGSPDLGDRGSQHRQLISILFEQDKSMSFISAKGITAGIKLIYNSECVHIVP